MVIRLSVRTRVDLEALEAGLSLLLIRITANVRILTTNLAAGQASLEF
jgi:hypothetical protein